MVTADRYNSSDTLWKNVFNLDIKEELRDFKKAMTKK